MTAPVLSKALALSAGLGWLSASIAVLHWLEPRSAWPLALVCLALLVLLPLAAPRLRARLSGAPRGGALLASLVPLLEVAPVLALPAPAAIAIPAGLAMLLQGHLWIESGDDRRAAGALAIGPLYTVIALETTPALLLLALLPAAVVTALVAGVLLHARATRRRAFVRVRVPEREERLDARARIGFGAGFGALLFAAGLAAFVGLERPPWRAGDRPPAERSAGAEAADGESRGDGSGEPSGAATGRRPAYPTSVRFTGGGLPTGDGEVLRVRPLPPSDLRPAPLLLRGSVMDHFDELGIGLRDREPPPVLADAADGVLDGWTVLGPAPAGEERMLAIQCRPLVVYPQGWTILFAPERSRSVSLPRVRYDADGIFVVPEALDEEFLYALRYDPRRPRERELERARARHADARFVQVPAGAAAARVAALAAELAGGLEGDLERVRAVLAHFDDGFEYALEDLGLAGTEGLATFVEQRRGYCTYFAGASVLMLRSLGIAARVAGGYVAHEWDAEDGRLVVRERDAHAWIEVYFEGIGWVSFDPTPPDPAERALLLAAAPPEADWSARLAEAFEDWRSSGGSLAELVRAGTGIARGLSPAWILFAAAVLLLLQRSLRGPRTIEPELRARPRPAGLQARLLGALARRGHRRRGGDTPREFARGVVAAEGPPWRPLARFVELFYGERFGGRPLARGEELEVERFVEQELDGRGGH